MGAPPPYSDVSVGSLLTQLAGALPRNDALVYAGGPRWDFASLDEETRLVARGLLRAGVQKGERVVVWATNVPEWTILQFAIAKVGAILVTANTALKSKEIEYLLNQCEAATLFLIHGAKGLDYIGELDKIGAFDGRLKHLKRIFYIDSAPGDPKAPLRAPMVPYQAMRASGEAVPAASIREDVVGINDVINMQYTSGTTGFPKGVMLTSRNIVNNGHTIGQLMGLTPADRCTLSVPLFHCFGCVVAVLGSYTHGAGLCAVVEFDPKLVLEMVHAERCTILHGVPTMFIAELELPNRASYNLTSLRTGVMAGALCPEPLIRKVMTDLHVPEITILYGETEASPGITMTPRDSSIAQRSQTVGPVMPGVEVKIVDAAGKTLPQGERGELCARGYNVMKGYYNNPEATAKALDADGWLHTGDEASMDPDGCFRITGRIKDLIIRGGENITPKDIETVLLAHPEVADASVYGVPDTYYGEAVAAAIRVQPGAAAKESDFASYAAAHLPKFQVPAYFIIVDEYPQTASGKIQKYKLREMHAKKLADEGRLTTRKAPTTPAPVRAKL